LVILYTTTIFLSAFLIFLVQPIIGKLLLPLAGGSPSVWNACMLFFQALMLAGYSYTHFSQKKFGVKMQTGIQIALMLATLLLLPIRFNASTAIPEDPTFWLLINLVKSAGIPFFILATLSPMLQLWFAHTGHRRAANPFFLYAASNTGSFVALLAYPFLIEPFVNLADQTRLWATGYAILTALIVICRKSVKAEVTGQNTDEQKVSEKIENSTIIKWVAAAFIPSSLLMGSTLFITTDLAPVPLLWILPLMVFLITFVIAFSSYNIPFWLIEKFAIAAILVFTVVFGLDFRHRLWLTMPLHLAVLFAICLYCHSYLARTKPSVNHLTAFYTWISAGGMLGGLFNTLIAPNVFTSYTEYPLMIFAGSVFLYLNRDRQNEQSAMVPSTRIVSLTVGLLTAASIIAIRTTDFIRILRKVAARHYFETDSGMVATMLEWLKSYHDLFTSIISIILALAPLVFFSRIKRFNLAAVVVAMLLCFYAYEIGSSVEIIYMTRNFFGVKYVAIRPSTGIRTLHHGSTRHGSQDLEPERRHAPLSYYHKDGPAGDIFSLPAALKKDFKAGIIGLGVGSMATYARPGNEFTFYEIDPDIIDMVGGENPIFSFIADQATQTRIISGDGRLKIAEVPAGYYDLIILDAFSSDAIPVHLITNEALQIYLNRLKPTGILAIHTSNRYLELQPVMKKLAEKNGLTALAVLDNDFDSTDKNNEMREKCTYVVMTKSAESIESLRLVKNKTWKEFATDLPDVALWTDSYSSIIPLIKIPEIK